MWIHSLTKTSIQRLQYAERFDSAHVLATLMFVLLGSYVAYHHKRISKVKPIPRIGIAPGIFGLSLRRAKKDFACNGYRIIQRGYQMHPGSIFKVQTNDMERIILSRDFVDELNALPDGVLSTVEAAFERYSGTLNCIRTSSLQSDACRIYMTQNLHRLVQPMSEEALRLVKALGTRGTGQPVKSAYHEILSVVVGITSRVLVGEPLCHQDEWLAVAEGYTMDVVHASIQLKPYPRWTRRFIGPWLQNVQRLSMRETTADKLLWDMAVAALEKKGDDEMTIDRVDTPESVFQWMAAKAKGEDRSASVLVRKTLFLTMAGVHTVTTAVVHALLDLCAHPEYIEPLRDEAWDLVNRKGWTLPALNGMKRLDSFMKESQRMNHPGLLSFNRKVMRPLVLSEGTCLPRGSIISMPTAAIANDPAKFSDPATFAGWRFYERYKSNLTSKSMGYSRGSVDEASHQYQYASTSPDSLPFGHGKLACPGRFYAAAQIKLILASVLLSWDVHFPNGQSMRPENIFFGESIAPDRTQKILFTTRQNL